MRRGEASELFTTTVTAGLVSHSHGVAPAKPLDSPPIRPAPHEPQPCHPGEGSTAFHLEQSRHYRKDLEHVEAWVAGDRTPPPQRWPHFAHWCARVSDFWLLDDERLIVMRRLRHRG